MNFTIMVSFINLVEAAKSIFRVISRFNEILNHLVDMIILIDDWFDYDRMIICFSMIIN